jgi:hypothetical protein
VIKLIFVRAAEDKLWRAFSASTKSTIEIFLLKGNATVQITASTDEHATIAATLLVKLRDVAKKAAGRM